MATISFKADEDLDKNLKTLAKKKGITTSAYIKLILTKGINGDLIEITENGLTVAEELKIINSDQNDEMHGPFKSAKSVISALKK